MAARNTAVFLRLASLLQFVQLLSAQFVFEFKLHTLTTNGDCVGFFDLFSSECETYLNKFCLRELDSSRSTDDSVCPLGSSGRFGPGGSLPESRQILSAQSWPGGFQMYIRAYDEDLDFDDHLDDIFIEMELVESNNFTTAREFHGDMNKVSVNMTFRVMMCQENFYGTNCDTFCLAQDDDMNGHYTCDDDGTILCRPGFENTSNNCRDVVNPCDSTPCANGGNCTAMGPFNYTCQCAPGYTGPACEDDIDGCLTMICPNNSVCVNGSMCACLAGFELTGELCRQPPTSSGDNTKVTTGDTDSQVGIVVIVGSSAGGGAVVLIFIVIIIAIVLIVVVVSAKRRSQSLGKLPDTENGHSLKKLELIKKSPLKKEDSMLDNPGYGVVFSVKQETSMSDVTMKDTKTSIPGPINDPIDISRNPIYGIDTAQPMPRQSTLHCVDNPVYGDPSYTLRANHGENIYSSPDQLPAHQSNVNVDCGSGGPQYAMIEVVSRNYSMCDTSEPIQQGAKEISQSTEALLEHEYAVVDNQSKEESCAIVSKYDKLKRDKSATNETLTLFANTTRLVECKDLGYSTLT